jgi:anti-sigma-K factor RskA
MTPDTFAPSSRSQPDPPAPNATGSGDRLDDWDWWAVRYRLDELDPDQCLVFEAALEGSQEARDALAAAAALIDTLEQALNAESTAGLRRLVGPQPQSPLSARSSLRLRTRTTANRGKRPLWKAGPWSLAAAALLALGVGLVRNLPPSRHDSTQPLPTAYADDERLMALATSWSQLRDESDSEAISDPDLDDPVPRNSATDFDLHAVAVFEEASLDDELDLGFGASLAWASFDRNDEPTAAPPSWILEATALTETELNESGPSGVPSDSSPNPTSTSPADTALDDPTTTEV